MQIMQEKHQNNLPYGGSSDVTDHKHLRYNQYQSNDLEVKPRSSKSASTRTIHRQRPAEKIDQPVTPDSVGI